MGVGGTRVSWRFGFGEDRTPTTACVYFVLESTVRLTNPEKLIRHTLNGAISYSICTIHWTCLHIEDINTENC